MQKLVKGILVVLALIFSFSILSFAYGPYIGDNYPQVYDLYWNNRTARWSVEGRANKYEVILYRDGRRVTTKTVTGRSRNFSSEMSRGEHEYFFEVRPYNSVTGWGSFEQSDSIYVEKSDYNPPIPYYPSGITPTYNGPGEGTNVPMPQTIFNPLGQWMQVNGYWHFLYSNGVYAVNSWLQIANKWYYVDASGNMAIGLVTINNSTFFFNPDGTMATGTIIINGITHFFDINGKMVY